jgi:PAS domain S-box-containing protein
MSAVLPPLVISLIRIFILALAYLLAGRLALLLAIPPGFVTAIFPPLGISLAAILIWGNPLLFGVFLGSALLNTSMAMSGSADFSPAMLIAAAEIALGSCLATWIGASLIKKWIGFPNALMDEWSIFIFFMVGGPIASIVSASVGVISLYLNGVISLSQFIYSWVTWWTGDAIGVLIAAPFVFILFAQPRSLWRNRFKTVGVPLIISCILMVSVFIATSNNEQQKIERSFHDSAKEMSDILFSDFTKNIDALKPLKGLYLASDQVRAEDFRLFTSEILNGSNGLAALSWNQYVFNDERKAYEAAMVKEGFNNFTINERNQLDQVVPALERKSYVVVTFVEPYAANQIVHGFDVSSEAIRNTALMFANQTGAAAMTSPLRLLQDHDTSLNYLIFMPVYRTLDVPKTLAMREELLRGYVTALVKINTQIEAIHHKFKKADFFIRFDDVTDKEHPVNLYDDGTPNISRASFDWRSQKNVAGRELELKITPTEAYLNSHRTMQSWFVLVGGLLFCSFLGGFLLLVTGRTEYISSLVERRTLELESILDGAAEAIIIINQSGHIERANPAAGHLFKMDDAQLIGRNSVSIIPLLHELLFASKENYSTPNDRSIWQSQETIGIRNDDTKLPIEIGVSRVILPDREIYTCLIHDIASRKKVDKLKSEFVSTVSHELRTPLTSITGALGLLVGGAVPDIPIKALDLLVIAKNNAERLGRLVNDILDIEKLEFGKLNLELGACDVNDLMRQAIDQNAGYSIKYGVHLALDNSAIATQKITILVDVDRFLQVMSNLISNAIKFSHMDGIVTLSASVSGDLIVFYVEDSGTGIPEEFRKKIFQKFAQADSSDTRKRDGTGLGLSISRVIVERMGGTIDYRTEINKGSVFFFSIPIEHSEPI